MKNKNDSPNVRKGQFSWMEQPAQELYLKGLRTKISQGYFYSDNILNKIVDEIAEVLSESAGCD